MFPMSLCVCKNITTMKNWIYKSKWFLFAALMGSVTACKDYLDINTDPNVPTSTEAAFLLPAAEQAMATGIQFDSRYVGKYVQYWVDRLASNQWDLHGYDPGSDNGGQIWRNHYWNLGKNLDLIIEDARSKGKNTYIGIAYAIRAWSWQTTTDVHGEAILKQAWDAQRIVFDYDTQEDIYKEVRRMADSALYYLNQTSVSDPYIATSDQLFKGDASKWRKFVKGVLARNQIHLTNKSSFNADSTIAYCDASLSSITGADDAFVPYNGNTTDDANFYGPLRNNIRLFRQSTYITNLLTGRNVVFKNHPDSLRGVDPRLPLMLMPSRDGNYRGMDPVAGELTSTVWNQLIPGVFNTLRDTATPAGYRGRFLFGDNAKFPIMTYSEIQLIKAEAQYRKGDKAGALISYKNAVSAHVDFLNSYATAFNNPTLSVAMKDTLLLKRPTIVPLVADSLDMSRIMAQKYLIGYGWNHVETWNDLRRYHYMVDKYENNKVVYQEFKFSNTWFAANGGPKPAYRLRPRYNSEYVWNKDALNKIGGLAGDFHTVELWFSKP